LLSHVASERNEPTFSGAFSGPGVRPARDNYFGFFAKFARFHRVSTFDAPAGPEAIEPDKSRLGRRFRLIDQDD